MQKALSRKQSAVVVTPSSNINQVVLSDLGMTEGRVLFLIVAVTILVYANSLGGQFLFDDLKQIVGNFQIRSWSNIWHAFTSDVWSFQRGTFTTDIPLPYYRPLFTIYLTLGYQLFGLWESGWHLMNLIVHTSATIAVYCLVRRLSGNLLVATLAALIFGVHPAHVESVSWISGIPDPLAALFYIPALLWYVRYREEGGGRWLMASVLAFTLSILCKETALTLPLVIAAWEMLRAGTRPWKVRAKSAVACLVPYGIIVLCYLVARYVVLGAISWKHPMIARVPDLSIWMTVPFVFVNYLLHLIAPFYLSLIYDLHFVRRASDWQFLLPTGLLTGAAVVLLYYRQRITSEMWMTLALFIAPLLPVLNLKVFHHEYIVQDRYLYLPSIGFCYFAALLIVRLARYRQTSAAALAAALLISFSISTIAQNRVWNNGIALWQHAASHAPHSWTTHYNLGLAYMDRKDYEAARAQFLIAARINPSVPHIYNNLALAEDELNNTDSAVANLQHALKLDPKLFEARNNLGAIFFRRSEYKAARNQFALALERDPSSASARFNLGRATAAMGEHAIAIPIYEAVIVNTPDDQDARYHLGLSYAATNRKTEAIQQIEIALSSERIVERAAEMRETLEKVRHSQ